MKAEALDKARIAAFVAYCQKHKSEIDDSFLYDEDLKAFEPDAENPTYIVCNGNGEIIAAASLIINDYYRRGRQARLRIFHSEIDDITIFAVLLEKLVQHTEGLDKMLMFIPAINKKLAEFITAVKFEVERYSYLLVCETGEAAAPVLPEDYELKAFVPGRDEAIWCAVRNKGFAKLRGSETPVTPEMVSEMVAEEDYIEGGMQILYHQDKPVGIVRGADDDYEDSPIMNIGPLALIPEYQGQGLGKALLRAALHFAREHGYNKTILCVNAENEQAKALYLNEGFVQTEAAACYRYDLKYELTE
ncbi:GNAT family N-acetyltransferase [Paenibacillus sp. sgz500958]|uniref:GNAT family N-acetyltransferase n=1 Tax=Paenibacillus sp. sgz500958 TaxID=3242475 RepID=UPI0036D33640